LGRFLASWIPAQTRLDRGDPELLPHGQDCAATALLAALPPLRSDPVPKISRPRGRSRATPTLPVDPLILLFIGMAVVIASIVWLKLNAFVAMLAGAIVVSTLTPAASIERHVLAQGGTPAAATARANETLGAKVAAKFGNTASQLGLLVAMASIVGACLLASGGAERIVRSSLAFFGEARAPFVFWISGFVLGIPVFFDTVFLLLIPLVRAMTLRTGRNFILYVLCTSAGATMTHSLVPPTPGPLFVATALKVDLALMMVGGIALGICSSAVGVLYAFWANRRWPKELIAPTGQPAAGSSPVFTGKADHELPPLWLALAPIFVPVLLISTLAIVGTRGLTGPWLPSLQVIGHPNIAMALAAFIALLTLAWKHHGDRTVMKTQVQEALSDAGMIILVTGAGGIFGGVLQETGVGERIKGLADVYRIGVLPLAFFVTALVRVAQGSATVAMVTGVGILSGFGSAATLGFHPLYLALAIGCGSKPGPWMNDSGFWVVCKTSGLSEVETLRTYSVMFTIMGFAGFGFVMLAAYFFPMV
jgi:GntP family gluconate:H+ symporter